MRRVTLMVAAMAVMVPLFAAVAYAATIVGTRAGDNIFETDRKDMISGRTGADVIDASRFSDDRDELNGNRGPDDINVQDGDTLDTANGGGGVDTCVGDPGEELKNCEPATVAVP